MAQAATALVPQERKAAGRAAGAPSQSLLLLWCFCGTFPCLSCKSSSVSPWCSCWFSWRSSAESWCHSKGEVSRAEMSLTEHRQAQPCSGGFLQPWTIQGSFSGLCTCSRTWAVLWESSGWESKASQHCSPAATYTCLCRQLILLIVLQKCCMFFSSLQSHSLELR